ncbi:MAG: ATP-binding protein [Chloroflexota bacterium]
MAYETPRIVLSAIQPYNLCEVFMTQMEKKADSAGAAQSVLDAIDSGAPLEAVFDCLVRELRKLMDFDLIALEWIDGENAVIGAVSTQVATDLSVGYTYPIKDTATGWVVEHRELLVKAAQLRLFPFRKETPAPGGIKSSVFAPVFSRNEVVGVVRLSSVRSSAYDNRSVQPLKQILAETGSALSDLRIREHEQERYDQLQKEQRERILLINTLAHELKTPLTAIVASGGLLVEELQGETNEARRKLAENIVRAASKLEARLVELVEMAKSEKTGFSLKMQLIDIRPLLENIAAVFRPIAAAKRQTLTLELAESVPLVAGDRQRLEQVVMNLLSNASKFTPAGGKIWLSLVDDRKRLVVKVRDNGPGIAAAEQERLFRPYYRIEADRDRYEGLGLGLALCKQIITSHGGRIWVESRRGEGSTFAFSLPVTELDRIPTETEPE